MKIKFRAILIIVMSVCLCASCQGIFTPAHQTDPDVEEYAVYNALLESRFSGGNISQVLIIDHTRVNHEELLEFDLASFQEVTPLKEDLINSFKARNQQPHKLEPDLDFGLDYQLLSQEEVDELHPQDEASGWKLFYEKYPDTVGFVYLSRVGFSTNFKKALVYMEQYHYDQPLQGGYYLLIKRGGGWEIENGYEWTT